MGRKWRSLQKPSPLVEGRFPQLCHALPNRGGQPPYGTRIRSKEEKQQHRGQGRFLHHCCEPFLNGIKWTPSLEFTECADGDSRLGVSGPWCCFHRHSSFYPVEFPNLSPKCCHHRYTLISQENSSNVYEFSLDQQLDSEFEILCHFHFKNFGLIVRFALSLVITCFVRV